MTLHILKVYSDQPQLQAQLVEVYKDMPQLLIESPLCRAEIFLQGAYVTSFVPKLSSTLKSDVEHKPVNTKNESYKLDDELLWLSPIAEFRPGKAIRGGIPICWPWFGKHPKNSSLPQHGFARTSDFTVVNIHQDDNLAVHVQLQLTNDPSTQEVWPFQFTLTVNIVLAESLSVTLHTENNSKKLMPLTQAIHSYFLLDNIDDSKLQGLEGCSFLDQLSDTLDTQTNPITITQETDRIYHKKNASMQLVTNTHPATKNKTLSIHQTNDSGTVVWNPWIKKSQAMSDFPDNGYHTMICVEAANAPEPIKIEAGQSYQLNQTVTRLD
jgi:D-hexose-6-phosphate mutarotase